MKLIIDIPVNIGDKVWNIIKFSEDDVFDKDDICESVIESFEIMKNGIYMKDKDKDCLGRVDDIGKPISDVETFGVYLSREEAEKAIATWNERRN